MMVAFVLAATVAPVASSSPLAPHFAKHCVSDAEIDSHIDARLPSWMRIEIRAVMLSLPPCVRGGHVGSTDSQGRLIVNDYNDYIGSLPEWAGRWSRVDAEKWRAPSGVLLSMLYEPTPQWLIGSWHCIGNEATPLLLDLRNNSTGALRYLTTFRGVNEQGEFIDFPAPTESIELYNYEAKPRPTIYLGMKNSGAAYSVEQTSAGMKMRDWGFYRDDRWNAMPTQPEWICTLIPQSPQR